MEIDLKNFVSENESELIFKNSEKAIGNFKAYKALREFTTNPEWWITASFGYGSSNYTLSKSINKNSDGTITITKTVVKGKTLDKMVSSYFHEKIKNKTMPDWDKATQSEIDSLQSEFLDLYGGSIESLINHIHSVEEAEAKAAAEKAALKENKLSKKKEAKKSKEIEVDSIEDIDLDSLI